MKWNGLSITKIVCIKQTPGSHTRKIFCSGARRVSFCKHREFSFNCEIHVPDL